jgi:hypothetical protein
VEDGESSFFAPDYVTPNQWRDLHRADRDSIKRLMLAMLEDALRDATGARCPSKVRRWNTLRSQRASARADARRSQRARARADEACAWIFDDGDDGPFAFQNVCDTLGFDGEALHARARERANARALSSPSSSSCVTQMLSVVPAERWSGGRRHQIAKPVGQLFSASRRARELVNPGIVPIRRYAHARPTG